MPGNKALKDRLILLLRASRAAEVNALSSFWKFRGIKNLSVLYKRRLNDSISVYNMVYWIV